MRAVLLLLTLLILGCGCAGAEQMRQQRVQSIETMQHGTVALVKRDPSDLEPWSYCSGVWLEERLFITAQHCVEDVTEVEYATYGAVREDQVFPFALPALVMKRDLELDLALVIVIDEIPPPHAIVRLAVAAPLLGDDVHLIGHTIGLPWSYSPGWVGGLRPEVYSKKVPVLQVFSAMGPGNSGGGVFDSSGNLLGICRSVSVSVPQIGFAVQSSTIRRFLDSPP